jgi:glucose-6-phosphate 1-epimerase
VAGLASAKPPDGGQRRGSLPGDLERLTGQEDFPEGKPVHSCRIYNQSMDAGQPMYLPESLNQFEIPDALVFEKPPGGLLRARVSTAVAEASVYLQGAHLTQWTPRGQRPVLFLSERSLFAPGHPIRGGVPIIFPWFGDRTDGKAGPAHGFARRMDWSLEETRLCDDGRLVMRLALSSNDTTHALGFDSFRAYFRLAIGEELEMQLEIHNDGNQKLTYEEALHSYFSIGDVYQISVSGLEGTTYIDKTDGFQRKMLGNDPIRIGGETDQVHLSTKTDCVLHDPVWNRRITIEKGGSESTIVWNPWIEKTKGIKDMGAEDWKSMICIETANAADNVVQLLPGESHKMIALIRVE